LILGKNTGGTGVTVSATQTVTVDSSANFLANAKVTTLQEAPATAEASCVIGRFFGNSFQNTPAELVSNVVGPRLEATAAGGTYPAEWYEFNLPVPAGVDISFTVENTDSNAGNTENTLDLIWSDAANDTPKNREFTRETINTTLTGPNLIISEGAMVTDLTTVMVPGGVVVADEEQTGRIFATSSGFQTQNTLSLSYAIHGIEATSGSSWTHPNRAFQSLPIIHRTATVATTLIETSGPTNPGTWFLGVGYRPIRVN